MWMVHAAGPAAGMTVPRTAIVAVALIGMIVAVMLLVLGMPRRPRRPVQGHRIRARTRHDRPGPRSPAAPVSWRPPAQQSQDPAARAGSFGYGPPSLWGDLPDDPRGWQ